LDLSKLISAEAVVVGFRAASRLDVLDELARRAALRARLDFLAGGPIDQVFETFASPVLCALLRHAADAKSVVRLLRENSDALR
jgi:hypothetical protein